MRQLQVKGTARLTRATIVAITVMEAAVPASWPLRTQYVVTHSAPRPVDRKSYLCIDKT
jgi:hypothetical protein